MNSQTGIKKIYLYKFISKKIGFLVLIFYFCVSCSSLSKNIEKKYSYRTLDSDNSQKSDFMSSGFFISCSLIEKKSLAGELVEKSSLELSQYANFCLKEKKWGAVQQISMILNEKYPELYWGFYYLSLVSEKEGALDKSLWFLDMAMKKQNNKEALLYFQRARIYWLKSNFGESLKDLEITISLTPSIPEAQFLLGQVYYQLHNYKASEKSFLEYLAQSKKQKSIKNSDNELAMKYMNEIYLITQTVPKDRIPAQAAEKNTEMNKKLSKEYRKD